MKNKIKMYLVLLCTISISSLFAQETVGGIKGGINLSNMVVDEINDENARAGFHIGFFVRSEINSFLAIQPELNFTTKGSRITYDYLFGEGETKFNFYYVEVPLLLVIEPIDGIRIQAGPYAGFLLGGTTVNTTDDKLLDFDEAIDKEDFNKVDFGIAAGLGVGGDNFEIGARYNYGLSDIGKDGNFNGLSYSLKNAHHSVLQVYIGLAF